MAKVLTKTIDAHHMAPSEMPYDAGEARDWHRHTCETCGTEWAHDGEATGLLSMEEYAKAHTCPECSKTEYWCSIPNDVSPEERREREQSKAEFEKTRPLMEAAERLLEAIIGGKD